MLPTVYIISFIELDPVLFDHLVHIQLHKRKLHRGNSFIPFTHSLQAEGITIQRETSFNISLIHHLRECPLSTTNPTQPNDDNDSLKREKKLTNLIFKSQRGVIPSCVSFFWGGKQTTEIPKEKKTPIQQ
jgi:hypothetical protein